MATIKNRHHARQSDYDLYGDIEKIKAAIQEATQDVKGRAGEIFSNSVEDIRDRSEAMRENMSSYAAERPFKTIGIALAVGLAIGYLLHK